MNQVIHGDCLAALRNLVDASVDAVVTDPPAGIAFMGKTWDGDRGGRDQWVAWLAERLAECLRVLKPGGHAVVWALPRTSGWTHRALEDAGFEIRDCITHLFGSGFPKSLDVGKALDKAAGAEREVVGINPRAAQQTPKQDATALGRFAGTSADLTAPATAEAQQWDGWGTALKPAAEFWYLARKPLAGTVAQTVQAHGTGALNIAATRVGTDAVSTHGRGTNGAFPKRPIERSPEESGRRQRQDDVDTETIRTGRWPANIVVTHNADCNGQCTPGCAAAELDEQSGISNDGVAVRHRGVAGGAVGPPGAKPIGTPDMGYGGGGGASRFFPTFRYQAKPSTAEKGAGLDDRNPHPTVKPVELMRWLVRLVTPSGGTVLDCFAGSGTTLVAATLEGFDGIGVEAEAEYLPIIEGRVAWAESQCQQSALPI